MPKLWCWCCFYLIDSVKLWMICDCLCFSVSVRYVTDVPVIDKVGGPPQITTGEDGRLETSGHVLFTQTQSMTDDTWESSEGRPISFLDSSTCLFWGVRRNLKLGDWVNIWKQIETDSGIFTSSSSFRSGSKWRTGGSTLASTTKDQSDQWTKSLIVKI